MRKDRFEMFTDAVVAIIMTLMILEIKLPDLTASNLPAFLQHTGIYALSFIIIAITWINHHNMFLHLEKINTNMIWLNFAMLFSMSLIPLATGHLGEHFFYRESHMLYGVVMGAVALPYTLLQMNVTNRLAKTARRDTSKINKLNWIATILYGLSVPLSLLSIYISTIIYVVFPIVYFVLPKGRSR